MKRAGCIRTAFGVESGNQAIFGRGGGQASDAGPGAIGAIFRRAGAAPWDPGDDSAFFIIGLPGETEATMERTRESALACELDPLVANFSIATPFPRPRRMYDTGQSPGASSGRDMGRFRFL